jgi:hypothetical protein
MSFKAMYETGAKTIMRCPKPSCKTTHIVDGLITEFWIKDGTADWQPRDHFGLISMEP